MQLENLLKEKFGHSNFRNGQKQIIEDILQGNDVIAMLPTGGGKSICYQLPGYLLNGSVLIISPLLSLMEDQVHQLRMIGEKQAIGLNSFLTMAKKQQALRNIHNYRFIFVSPEILQSNDVLNALKRITISLLVIDEAHCISQWGHDFRPDYSKLGEIRQQLGAPSCLALTATATNEVLKDMIATLNLEHAKKHLFSVDRPNIALSIEKVELTSDKQSRLLHYTKTLQGPGIIYFSSRKMAENMAEFLKNNGVKDVAYYHGGMEQEQRILIQQQFIYNQLQIICCTNAFGMGVNKPNIRYVIHFHMPQTLESYLQEIGRAGRDGNPSIALLFYTNGDEEVPKMLMEFEFPTPYQIKAALQFLTNTPGILKLTKRVEEEVMMITEMSETGWRFIKYYLEKNNLIIDGDIQIETQIESICTDITDSVEKRLAAKHQKFQFMMNWIITNNCLRKNLLAYFNEIECNKPDVCCDKCGFNKELFCLKSQNDNVWHFKDWRQELDDILF